MVSPRGLNWRCSLPAGHGHGSQAARGKRQHDEHGAALVLALLFLVVVGVTVSSLLDWSGNDLTSVAHFQQSRTLEYAAGSAMQVQMQTVRYDSSKCTNASIPIPNPSGTVTIDIWCSTVFNPTSAATRVVTLTACGSAQPTCSQANPYLTVVVTFDDYSSTNLFVSTSSPCTPATSTSCGTSMTINSWTFK
jgi:hypothetical protein